MNLRKNSGKQPFNPIMRTKLHIPQLSTDLVDRDRLNKMMDRSQEVLLTLVCAPAGYGKSVLTAQWCSRLQSSIAWLSLDAEDSDLRTFLEYFLAALNDVVPDICEASRALVQAASPLTVPAVANYLLNDLDALDTTCTIVLDDYHKIEPLSPVQELMRRMLAHPPEKFHIVILSRHDPPLDLLSLRARNSVNDVRLKDLRFTAAETTEFLCAKQSFSISDAAVTRLDFQVEGWGAGLRLVALALQHVDDPETFIKALPSDWPEIQNYLLHEVLDKQSTRTRDYLLVSAILNRFCVKLLDTICACSDIGESPEFAASNFLDELLNKNLFTISLDTSGKWFRYHHLFQELLVEELHRRRGPNQVAALRLRASRWFEDEGLIDEAIQQAMAAGDVERAVELVTRHRHEALNDSQWYVLDRWLALVGTGSAQQNAELLIARAWIALNYHYNVKALPPILSEVEAVVGEKSGYEELRGELELCRGYVLWLIGNGTESLQSLATGLAKIPVEHTDLRSNAELVFAQAKQMVDGKEEALHFLDELLAHAEPLDMMREARLTIARVFVYLVSGDLLGAQVANRRMWKIVERGFPAYGQVWTEYMEGVFHLQRCEWEAAIKLLGRSVANRFIHHARAAVDSFAGLMLAQEALGQPNDAQATLKTLKEYAASLADPAMEKVALSAEGRLAVFQGQLGKARRRFENTEPSLEEAYLWWVEVPPLSQCQTLLATGSTSDLVTAETLLRECTATFEAQHNSYQMIRALALLALVCERQQKTEEAIGILQRTIAMARVSNFVLPFVELGRPMVGLLNKLVADNEFATKVEHLVNGLNLSSHSFAAGGVGPDTPQLPKPNGEHMLVAGNGEELTNREQDILNLLARRMRNKEIAKRLCISHHTVDSHLKQIYRKLDAHGRREAVEAARKSGLL